MKEALLIVNGESRKVSLLAYEQFKASNRDVTHRLACSKCKEPVHPYRKMTATQSRYGAVPATLSPSSGFHHFDNISGTDCPKSFAKDLRKVWLNKHNKFSPQAKTDNKKVLANPHVRKEIQSVQQFVLQTLTLRDQTNRSSKLTKKQEKDLKKVESMLMRMEGFAEHPWILGYLGPWLMGPQDRTATTGKIMPVVLVPEGELKLPLATADNGQERFLVVPEKLVICFSPKKPRDIPKPLRYGKDGPMLKPYVLSRCQVENIVTRAETWTQKKDSIKTWDDATVASTQRAHIKKGTQLSLFASEPQEPSLPVNVRAVSDTSGLRN